MINPGYPELEQEELRDCARSKFDIVDLLKVLSCYSLFSIDHRVKVFGVHKLVQEVVRESLTTKQRVETLVAATRLLRLALKVKTSGTCVNIFKHGYGRRNGAKFNESKSLPTSTTNLQFNIFFSTSTIKSVQLQRLI